MRFDNAFLDEIRARLPVSQVVSRHVQLKRQGREFKGLSPFKDEKTPSFTVNDQKAFYHCFATGEHGDIFKFLMQTEGLAFPEAVERLAGEAGVPMPVVTPEMQRRQDDRDRLYDLLAASQAFFRAQLESSAGRDARRYLEGRELTDDIQNRFGLGYAPNNRMALKDHLLGLGFSDRDAIRSGMLIGGEDISVSYDRFRHRIMFPIADLKGRVIAFGGRALDPDQPAKYLNSPETPLFHKGHVLYNAAGARQAAYESGEV
ncbi:MAG: DNA primase, partial [Hyphomicrobiaceae bacterium]